MPDHHEEIIRHSDGRVEHPAVRHERTDARFGPIVIILAAAACFALFHMSVIGWFLHRTEERQAVLKRSEFPLATGQANERPKGPRLEMINRLDNVRDEDVRLRIAAQQKRLGEYGPTEEKGYVHIPIDEALKVAEKQLNSRKEPAEQPPRSNGLVGDGASNSGRMLRRTPR